MQRRQLILSSMAATAAAFTGQDSLAQTLKLAPSPASLIIPPSILPSPKIVGQGQLKVLVFHIFEATLFAPEGRFSFDDPFALQLKYLRNFAGRDITSYTLREIRKQGFTDEKRMQKWGAEMNSIFPDVQAGMRLTGVRDSSLRTLFYLDGREIGAIKTTDFTPLFFNIWLGPKTSQPRLRQQLLGQI
jgi:hypothetical protein